MLPIFKAKPSYSSIKDDDCEEELKLTSSSAVVQTDRRSFFVFNGLILASIILTWISLFVFLLRWQSSVKTLAPITSSSNGALWVCQQPSVRREWRILSEPEKVDYLTAVQCLATKPSKLRNNGTLYDDFPWVHKHTSSNTHVSAPFLPWHRYYIHLYEKVLKEDCSFSGVLPYWDWSQDWSSFSSAPVWPDIGGNGMGESSVGDGRCVTSGPFSRLELRYYDGAEHPHCLSRGFAEESDLRELGALIQPSVIDELMAEPDYEVFATELERRAHKFLSHSIKGDLSRFTGPNDPVFFLHHTNLDRLWWQWQQTAPKQRVNAYKGKANNNTENRATLMDVLDVAGLSRNLKVTDVMGTTEGLFCYTY